MLSEKVIQQVFFRSCLFLGTAGLYYSLHRSVLMDVTYYSLRYVVKYMYSFEIHIYSSKAFCRALGVHCAANICRFNYFSESNQEDNIYVFLDLNHTSCSKLFS
jgi:succinylarginine dihydrolase